MRYARLLLFLCAAQCATSVPGLLDDTYPCRDDADCVDTHACIGGRCRVKGSARCPTVDCSDSACEGQACGANGRRCTAQACSCSGNGGAVQPSELECGDGFDNDCDGLTDCADDGCNGQACSNGGTCSGAVCVCPAAGGAPQPVENLCGDGLDNDCDGLTDCADPSCGNVGCGMNGRICVADAGACQCGGNGGAREGSETVCGDLADNDCDGKTDCADETCDAVMCRANGFVCGAMACMCTGNGGVAQPAGETSCTDGFDNDCDGMGDCADSSCDTVSCGAGCACGGGVKRETACTDMLDNDTDQQQDCADPDCAGVTCGMFGLKCSMGSCRCVVDGGTAQATETLCGDGRDNDCNGVTDCDEAGCNGLSCGANGRACVGTACTCFVDGGVTEPSEVTCNDGRDNDCDGLTDCAEAACAGTSCGTGCFCTGGVRTETICNDGIDNDGDGQTDCADSQCSHRQCGASAAQVCCGTVCRNLSNDSSNCGGCGLACAFTCTPATAGGVASGHCTCNGNGNCPGGQTCGGGTCACNAVTDCATGQTCSTSVCRY